MSEALASEYLTCSLCSKPFHQPKTLPCLHSFCKACLNKYLEEEMSGGRGTTFECPQCREKIFVPDPSKPANRWASQFPTNFTLSGMIEAIEHEAEAKGRGVAMVKEARERRGILHKYDVSHPSVDTDQKNDVKVKRLSQEDLSFCPDLQGTQDNLSRLHLVLQEEEQRLEREVADTDKHEANEKKKLYQSFDKIYTLLEARKAQLVEELTENLEQDKQRLQQSRQGCQNDLKSLASCQKLLKGLDAKPVGDDVVYDMLLSMADQIKEIESRQLTAVTGRTIKFEQTLEAARSVLNLVNDLGQVTISTSSDAPTPDGGDSDHDKNGKSAPGSRAGSEARDKHKSSSFDEADHGQATKVRSRPKFLTTISSQQDDGAHRDVYSIAVTANGTVIMTSKSSNIVQAAKRKALAEAIDSPEEKEQIDTNSGAAISKGFEIFSSLELDSHPKCVVAIAPFYVAITGSSCIYLVAVDKQLSLHKKVPTGKDYQGIAMYSDSNLIATSLHPPCMDFVSLNGHTSETVDRDHTTGNVLLRNPQFLTASKDGAILATDLDKQRPKLIRINNAGKVIFEHPTQEDVEASKDGSKRLILPQGICVDSQGHIFVVDQAASKVVLLTSEGQKVKDIITSDDGLTQPCAIAVDDQDRIYITNDFKEILVYQVR